jgi:cell division protein FtsW
MTTTVLGNPRSRQGSAGLARQRLWAGNEMPLLVCILGLLAFGLVMVMSASAVASMEKGQGAFGIFLRQAVFATFGIALMVFLSRTPYQKTRKFAPAFLLVTAALLVLVLIPGVGSRAGGASRWLGIGSVGIQPSEFAKLALVLYCSAVLTREQRLPESPRDYLVPTLPVVVGLGALVMAQPDLGTAIALGLAYFSVLWTAGLPLATFGFLGTSAGAAVLALALSADYRKERLFSFMNPWADPGDTGYHAVQSMIAIGSGGLTGVGLGAGRQKWLFLPNAHTDFVFAVIGEELGLIGCAAVLLLFFAFALFGLRTALRAPDRYGRLVAAGITGWLVLQAFVNIGVTTGRLPVTGIPLPFLSSGGSALLAALAAAGILLNIARQGDASARAMRRSKGRSRSESGASPGMLLAGRLSE